MAYTFKHGDRPLDDYTIQRAVGRGGFGEVYYAVSDGGREVALKYLRENPQVELRGISHCINLKSPHLVSIFDVRKNAEGEYFVIMEYCSGPSLRDLLIAEPKGFAPEKAAFFTREIAKGLSYLHERGIVHRDLKPGNIFFDDGYVKIGDYGLSKFIAISRHSAQTASVGTVHYMAPEIGSGHYSRGVDIYALGVMLYEMLLGQVPFEGSSMAEVLMKHLTAQPELDQLPQPFGRVIRKALQKDPNDRYQNVDEMVEEMLSGEEIQKSLAGFSAKSLEGAVRVGGADRADSPIPSPNPTPKGGGFVFQADLGRGALPDHPNWTLPGKFAKKYERITKKIEKKMAKLGGRLGNDPPRGKGRSPFKPNSPPSPDDHIPFAQPAIPVNYGERLKRMALMTMLTLGLATTLGIGVGFGFGRSGGAEGEVLGPSAGLLVVALSIGLLLGRKAIQWFSVSAGPKWAQRLILACASAPFLALGCLPLFVESSFGLAIWLVLLAFTTINNWDKDFECGSDGEIRFGPIFGNAIFAAILTAISLAFFDNDDGPERVFFFAPAVVAAVTFIVQAGSWWTMHRVVPASHPLPPDGPPPPPSPGHGRRLDETVATPMKTPPYPPAPFSPTGSRGGVLFSGSPATPFDPNGPVLRSLIGRMFWSLVAFVLMGGTIVAFLYSVIVRAGHPHDITAAILFCCGFSAAMVFALRKTTTFRRIGFWRETLRPFLISVSLFGIGGTTTAIAREWDGCHLSEADWSGFVGPGAWARHRQERREAKVALLDLVRVDVQEAEIPEPLDPAEAECESELFCDRPCLNDEGKVGVVSGLVMSSLMFVLLQFFTGGKPKSRPPAAFLTVGDSGTRPPSDHATT